MTLGTVSFLPGIVQRMTTRTDTKNPCRPQHEMREETRRAGVKPRENKPRARVSRSLYFGRNKRLLEPYNLTKKIYYTCFPSSCSLAQLKDTFSQKCDEGDFLRAQDSN